MQRDVVRQSGQNEVSPEAFSGGRSGKTECCLKPKAGKDLPGAQSSGPDRVLLIGPGVIKI